MDKKIVVVALGHRALGTTLPEQKEKTKEAAKVIADLAQSGARVVVTHSNAPQVGMIHAAMNEFAKNHEGYTATPMSVCAAMSQGYIGYDLQNSIRAELVARGIYKPVATVITQVKVNTYDEAFYQPSKVVGRVLSMQEAEAEEEKGNFVIGVEGGFKRIVAAPKPQAVIEIDTIKTLVDAGQIVVACGGGGIPVMEQGVELRGASAVIEKDLASGKLAELLNASCLMMLTGVERVCLDYKSDKERRISHLSVEDAKRYAEEGQFEAGTMLPKIEAGISFIEKGVGCRVIITDLKSAKAAQKGKAGTLITQ